MDLQLEIQELQAQISLIQQKCAHDQGYTCMMYSYRVGAFNPSRICNSCHLPVPGITQEESDRVYNGFYTVVQQTGQFND